MPQLFYLSDYNLKSSLAISGITPRGIACNFILRFFSGVDPVIDNEGKELWLVAGWTIWDRQATPVFFLAVYIFVPVRFLQPK